MNNDEHKPAAGEIKTDSKLKAKAKTPVKLSGSIKSIFRIKIPPVIIAVLILFACISAAAVLPSLWKGTDKTNAVQDLKTTVSTAHDSASYISVVYLDGYAYQPSEWLKYSRYGFDKEGYQEIKGDKLGVVNLDLKGKAYPGTPPDFSSTHDLGTEIYSIKNIKKERAVLVIGKGFAEIFYRDHKAVRDEKTPINLTLSDVFRMVSDSPKVTSVELRDENDGSWMRTSKGINLLSLINKELPKLPLLSSAQIGDNPYGTGRRIPINLVFEDGAALHFQVLPEANAASIFGGFVKLSPELITAVEKLFEQGEQYPSISNLLPYKESEISYMYFTNHTNGDKILCKEPLWSRTAMFSIFNYYRVEEVKFNNDQTVVMTATIGKSKNDSITVNFYSSKDKNIIINLNGRYYIPVRGQMVFDELNNYLYNYTGLEHKTQ